MNLKINRTKYQELSFEKIEKIYKMFTAMDTDGDGFISAGEFESYFRKMEFPLGVERVNELFRLIQLDQQSPLKFQDFVHYFKHEPSPPQFDVSEETLESIKNIEEYIMIANAAGVNVCGGTLEIIAEGLRKKDLGKTLNKLLAAGSSLQESLSDPGERRWKPFLGFKRRVEGQTVLTAPMSIVRDLLPGNYCASELAQYWELSKNLEPRKTVIEGVHWEEGEWEVVKGRKVWVRDSRLIFPKSFDGVVETDVRDSLIISSFQKHLTGGELRNSQILRGLAPGELTKGESNAGVQTRPAGLHLQPSLPSVLRDEEEGEGGGGGSRPGAPRLRSPRLSSHGHGVLRSLRTGQVPQQAENQDRHHWLPGRT